MLFSLQCGDGVSLAREHPLSGKDDVAVSVIEAVAVVGTEQAASASVGQDLVSVTT